MLENLRNIAISYDSLELLIVRWQGRKELWIPMLSKRSVE